MEASLRKPSALRLRFSQSLASRRQRLSQGDGAFNNPALGQHDEALGAIGSLDDLGLELGLDASQCAMKDRPLIGAVGEQFCQEGEEAE